MPSFVYALSSDGKLHAMYVSNGDEPNPAVAFLPANANAVGLTVTDGVVGDGTKTVSYADLIGGRYFNVQLEWNKTIGNDLTVNGQARPKLPSEYKTVGKPGTRRRDVAPTLPSPAWGRLPRRNAAAMRSSVRTSLASVMSSNRNCTSGTPSGPSSIRRRAANSSIPRRLPR